MNLSQRVKKEYLNKSIEIAFKAGKNLLKYWGKLKEIKEKQYFSNLVTEADKSSENVILKELNKHFQGHAILSEEAGLHSIENSEFLWVVDPLDGTTNFAHQFPFFSVSIGLIYQKRPIVGVVYNPYYDELFSAAEGCGAKKNGKKIVVSKVNKIQNSLLATGFAYDRNQNPDTNYSQFCHLTSITHGVRRIGSAALDLAYVSCGALEGFWERGLQAWDMGAGVVILNEAGGKVSDYDGSPFDITSGRIVATNGSIHEQLCRELLHDI